MKFTLLLLMVCLAFPYATYASGCDDVASAAGQAAKARNQQIRENLNTTVPDPEEDRGALASCMDAVNALGAAFSMGVQTPGMDEIIEKMCDQADSYVQQKINNAMQQAESGIENSLGKDSPFQVSLSPEKISGPLTGQLK